MSKVYLVGAGPGDPELITVKGRRVLSRADVVLFDHLASQALLDHAPRGVERVYVGKKKAAHSHSQDEINELLIRYARLGKTVVRLKGGDPFLFGRGGEEIEALAEAGVPFEVVPGVTSPCGIAAYTGVPLTHRDHASVVTFVTGHEPDAIDWDRVGRSETLVVYMGLTSIRRIVGEIVSRGRSGDTPAMAVRWGTRPDQQTVAGTLATIADLVESTGMRPPATVVIGEVVSLRGRLSWFERLPLFGQRVVVTRAAEQAGEFSDRLREMGADVLEFPVIELRAAADPGPLDRAIEQLEAYDWVVFTSANGVRFFLDRLDRSKRDVRALRGKICAIGPATRVALESLHWKVDLAPEQYVAEIMVAAFAGVELSGKRVLLPRAAVARDVIPNEFAQRGAWVDVVEAYRTVMPVSTEGGVSFGRVDWVTFTSSSTVKNFLAMAGRDVLLGARVASIGPVTSETLRKHGLRVDVEAGEFTTRGLVAAIVAAGPHLRG